MNCSFLKRVSPFCSWKNKIIKLQITYSVLFSTGDKKKLKIEIRDKCLRDILSYFLSDNIFLPNF